MKLYHKAYGVFEKHIVPQISKLASKKGQAWGRSWMRLCRDGWCTAAARFSARAAAETPCVQSGVSIFAVTQIVDFLVRFRPKPLLDNV